MPNTGKSDPLTKHLEAIEAYLIKANEKFMKKWNGDITDIGAFKDFELIKVIGNGAFGTVFMASVRCACNNYKANNMACSKNPSPGQAQRKRPCRCAQINGKAHNCKTLTSDACQK